MNILVTGASGFIGSHLIDNLDLKKVKALGRSRPKNIPSSQFYKLSIRKDTDFVEPLYDVDIVVHLAARAHIMNDQAIDPLEAYREVNTYGTINLAKQAAASGVKRFIFVSSIKVNGELTGRGRPFSAFDERSPQDYYGQSKSEAEQELFKLAQETDMDVVVIRPPLVYGPGVKANFSSLLDLISKGIPLPFGLLVNNSRSLVSVNNLVDLILTCLEHPKAANKVFLVSDDHDVSTSEMVREMGKALGKKSWQFPVPVWCYKLLGNIAGKLDVVERLTESLQVDISQTKKILSWNPPQSLEAGFEQTAKAYLKSKNDGNS